MRRIIDYARQRGVGEIVGDGLRENTTALRVRQELGLTKTNLPDEPGLVRVVPRLRDAAAERPACS